MIASRRKEAATARAHQLYERLMALPRDPSFSNNEWARKAGVNTSFFTNLKNGSEPSVGNLRAVLEIVGSSLPEFFLDEAQGRLLRSPVPGHLTIALEEALSSLPKNRSRRASYLSEVVLGALALPLSPESKRAEDVRGEEISEAEQARVATKRASRG